MSELSELWSQFWTWTESHPSGSYLFRGQGERSSIRPKIGRDDYNYSPAREKQLFDAFERMSRPFLRTPLTPWELLALAQHHGVPTRLLDWSTNAIVAAWFAVSSFPHNKDAVIFALKVDRDDIEPLDSRSGKATKNGTFDSPLAIQTGVYLIETAPVSERITTQRGIFTLHGQPKTGLAVLDGDTFVIPEKLRSGLQGRLLDLGIDASHIYPGLDGLCQTLDWRMRNNKPFSSIA